MKISSLTKIEAQRYTLKPRDSRRASRVGSLLRVSFSDLKHPGLADIFPWASFGDPSLDVWISELESFSKRLSFGDGSLESLHPTLRLALQAARDEAEALELDKPLVQSLVLNHWLSTDATELAPHDVLEARRAGAPAIKVKIGHRDPKEEAAALGRLVSHWGSLRLRLDANERCSRDQLMTFLDALPILIRSAIEFIEDPFAFEVKTWREFHRETGIAIAYDRAAMDRTVGDLGMIFEEGAAQVLVHKPAWQEESRAIFARERGRDVVVTSILGHPIGNLWAASRVAILAPEGVHGCYSQVVYRDDEAALTLAKSKQLRGARIVGIGAGLGLQSKWLSRIKWEPLS